MMPSTGTDNWAAGIPPQVSRQVTEALAHFESIVASDGGGLGVVSLELGGELVVAYKKGINERCQTCVITHEDLAIFIEEALEARSVDVGSVRVVDPPAE